MKTTTRIFTILLLLSLGACDDDKTTNPTPDGGTSDMVTKTDTDQPDDGTTDTSKTDTSKLDMGSDLVQQEGVLIPGLSGKVDVSFDSKGVLHASCMTDEDCVAVEGYYHAANRFIQMDIQRRVATGKISGLIGDLALGFDESSRLIFSTREGEPLGAAIWKTLKPKTKGLFEAYTRGVNAFLDDAKNGRNGATLSEEYDHAIVESEIEPWTVEDSIAGSLLLLEDLSNSSGGDLSRGRAYARLGNDTNRILDLIGTMSATQVSTMAASGETYGPNNLLRGTLPGKPDLSALVALMKTNRNAISRADEKITAFEVFLNRKEFETGSNNWVVGKQLTNTGNTMLANDPHLGLSNPALWYLVELDAKTNGTGELHVAGVSLPGLPGILLGHNEKISWGGTVMFYDLADVYIEELSPDKKGVMFNGVKVPFTEIDVEFPIARDQPRTKTLRWVPHHGPVIDIDEQAGTALTVRWTGSDGRTDIEMFFDMMRSENVEDARKALLQSVSTNQNWVIADTAGDIAWYPYSSVPKRPWVSAATPAWTPLDGKGGFEWEGRVAYDKLPQMKNPTNHFIATTNTDPTGAFLDGDPTSGGYYLTSYGEFAGFRQQAVVDRLKNLGDGEYTMEYGMDMQGSTFLVLRDWIVPHLVADYDANQVSDNAKKIYQALMTWDGTCPTGLNANGENDPDMAVARASVGCSAFHHYIKALAIGALGDEYADAGFSPVSLYAWRTLVILLNNPERLQNGETYFDNATTAPVETKSEILLLALEEAYTDIVVSFGSPDANEWRWGKVHTIELRAPVLANANLTQFNESFAAPSGLFAINVANPAGRAGSRWGFESGPSMRHVSEMNPAGVESYWTLPGGQTHRRDSPLYQSLLDDWLNVNYFKMPFSRADADAAAMTTLVVNPKAE